MKCLDNLVGLTNNKDCDCLLEGVSYTHREELTKSLSGLYIDTDLDGVFNLRALKNPKDCRDIGQKFIAIRDASARRLRDDLLTAIESNYQYSSKNIRGTIGQNMFAGNMSNNMIHHYIKLEPKMQSDAVIRLKKIQIVANEHKVMLTVLRSEQGTINAETIYYESFETESHRFSHFDVDFRLPLTENGKIYNYYIGYSSVTGSSITPKSSKIDCGCGGKNKEYERYIRVGGVSSRTVKNLNELITDSDARGIVLDMEIKCDGGNIVCNQYDDSDAIARTLANALLYKVGEKLLDSLLGSDEVSRYVTIKKEYVIGKIKEFNYEYTSRILALRDAIDVNSSDCFICKQRSIRKVLL